jgi:hypothetical protein
MSALFTQLRIQKKMFFISHCNFRLNILWPIACIIKTEQLFCHKLLRCAVVKNINRWIFRGIIMFKFKKYLIASALATMFASQAQAAFIIDSFDDYATAVELTSSGAAVSDTRLVLSTGISVDYTVIAATAFVTVDNSVLPFSPAQNGILSYSASNTPGELTLKYYDAVPGAGGFANSVNNTADFTQFGDNFYISLADAVDGPFDVEFTVSYWNGMGLSTETVSFTVADGQSGDIFVAFGDFMSADFTQIESSTVVISSTNPNADFDIDEVGIVPEPSTLAILGLGLIGLGLRARKKLV